MTTQSARMLVFLAPLLLLLSIATGAAPAAPAEAVAVVMRRAFDYELARQSSLRPGNGWIRSAFHAGVMAAHTATDDEAYLDAARRWAVEQGNWTPRGATGHADNQACGQTYVELFLLDRDRSGAADARAIEPTRRAFDAMMHVPRRGREAWSWCDALFMAPPVLARLHAATGDGRYLALLDEMWWDATEHLFSPGHGLYFRDASFFNRKTGGGRPVFWSRGNGWAIAGLARVIEYLPEAHPSRERYVALLRQMAEAVAAAQGPDGLWRTSLLDPEQFPMPETSGSAFFCYALAWGVNHGHLDRGRYLPVVERAWRGLVDQVNEEGRLGSVQGVANAPARVRPGDTHEYAVGALLLAGAQVIQLDHMRFDFGRGATEKEYVAVGVGERDLFAPERGYGWTAGPSAVLRDRRRPDALRRDYVFGREPQTFRVAVRPGVYRLTLVMGETDFGDHVLRPRVNVEGVSLPELRADAGEFATLTAAFEVTGEALDVTFDSPVHNWIINAMTIEPATQAEAPKVTKERVVVELDATAADTWPDTLAMPDPIKSHADRFRRQLAAAPAVEPTGLTRADYLSLIAGNVDYFRQHQDADGAIIDPHKGVEWQYSTPCFALAAAALVAHAGREDLLEPAAKAMDWSCRTLRDRKAANAHEDFFPPPIAHALPLLAGRVAPERARRWEEDVRAFKPVEVYRARPGGNNWNVVALSGEYLFHKLGLRDDVAYVEHCLAAQGKHFGHPYGLYTEGPMPYDHFPRLWAADMVAAGYDGTNAEKLREALRRAALASLFMQSPTGELPAGGRSAHHQWNEAEQCVTYEIYAARALAEGDAELAGVFKRAARLALGSMKRWQRPSGELWIVKNHADPADRHGYESYSAHSQYNLLAMAMLAIAHEHAAATEDVAERWAPAELGGFVLDLRQVFRKVFANAGGTYVEIDTAADPAHNPTGLLRVHRRGGNPQLGPSDGLTASHKYELPAGPGTTAAVGAAWQDVNGNWRRLAEFPRSEITNAALLDVQESPDRVSFQIVYQGYFSGPSFVSERYVVTPDGVELTVELPNYAGPVRMVWPVVADLGGGKRAEVTLADGVVTTALDGDAQAFTPVGATAVRVEDELYPHRNGWARLGVAEYPVGASKAVLRIEPAGR